MPRLVSEEVVVKALGLTCKKISDDEYIVGHVISFNKKFQKHECDCTYNQKQHKECACLAKFYIDNPKELRK